MLNIFPKKNHMKCILLACAIALPAYAIAAENNYNSELVNETKQAGSEGFKLVKTRIWPESGCVIDSGKKNLNPGDSTNLTIKKSKECSEDTQGKNLLGYLSHRFRDGKFSIQVSIFCEGKKCLFRDLNPLQNRGNTK
jgi:hypothetical protein